MMYIGLAMRRHGRNAVPARSPPAALDECAAKCGRAYYILSGLQFMDGASSLEMEGGPGRSVSQAILRTWRWTTPIGIVGGLLNGVVIAVIVRTHALQLGALENCIVFINQVPRELSTFTACARMVATGKGQGHGYGP